MNRFEYFAALSLLNRRIVLVKWLVAADRCPVQISEAVMIIPCMDVAVHKLAVLREGWAHSNLALL